MFHRPKVIVFCVVLGLPQVDFINLWDFEMARLLGTCVAPRTLPGLTAGFSVITFVNEMKPLPILVGGTSRGELYCWSTDAAQLGGLCIDSFSL
jgi:hypothetical protein